MDIKILEVDKNGLIEEILKLCNGTMEFVTPIISIKEAVEGNVLKNPNQFIRIRIGDKELKVRIKESEESQEAGLTQGPEEELAKNLKETSKGMAKVPIEPIVNDDGKNDIILRIFRSELSANILSCINNSGGATRGEITTVLGYKTPNNIYMRLKRLEKAKLIKLGGRNGKNKITERGTAFLEEYEKKNGKIELPEKVVIQEQEEVKPLELEKPEEISEKEKLAKIQEMIHQGAIITSPFISETLKVSVEEAEELIKKIMEDVK